MEIQRREDSIAFNEVNRTARLIIEAGERKILKMNSKPTILYIIIL